MANRKGVFIGAYVPNDLKETLRRRAAAEHRTLSQEIRFVELYGVQIETLTGFALQFVIVGPRIGFGDDGA